MLSCMPVSRRTPLRSGTPTLRTNNLRLRSAVVRPVRSDAMKNTVLISAVLTLTAGLFAGGCNKSTQTASGHGHDHKSGPPHGGTPVQVGGHDFHLELVNDAGAGKMLAYVFDAHLEHAESVPPTTFELTAKVGGTEQRAIFNPGDGSRPALTEVNVFHATADWLK